MARTFKGGVHPHDYKELSKDRPIEDAPAPDVVFVSLRQHIGAPSKPVVKPGDEVKKGQLIAEPGGFVSAACHSPVSGKVKSIKPRPHMMGTPVDAIEIENDGREEWAEGCNVPTDWENLSVDELKKKIAAAGIVGLGGATFPTHVKLSPPPDKKIDAAILNGVECEPYLTADHRLMLEQPDRVLEGFRIIQRILGGVKGYIGIEANKPDAYMLMKEKAMKYPDIEVVMLPVKYPQGAEKQLIKAILDREVPSGGLPMDVGCVVQNVGTAAAVYDACARNVPLIERIMTVTGDGVERPANYRIRIGQMLTPILERSGLKEGVRKLIFGGPMMGLAQAGPDIPLAKGNSGVVAMMEAPSFEPRMCIRCSRCVDHCPMGLEPSVLSLLSEARRYLEMAEHDVLDCIECGVCTYICPARRPIVQQIKIGKQKVLEARKKK